MPSDVYMSSALPAFGKHRTRSLHAIGRMLLQSEPLGQATLGHCMDADAAHDRMQGTCLGGAVLQAVLLRASPGNHLAKVAASGGGKGGCCCAGDEAMLADAIASVIEPADAAAPPGLCCPPFLK